GADRGDGWARRDPTPPRKTNPRVDTDLQTICLKCLEKEPARRYSSAEALAIDLHHWLDGKPIEARPVGSLGRVRRWCRRNPVLTALLAMIAALLALGVAGLIVGLVVVSRSWLAVERQQALLRQRLYPTDMGRAYRFWRDSKTSQLADVLALYEPRPGEDDLRGFEWHFLNEKLRRSQSDPRLIFRGHKGTVFHAAFSPDGKTLASGGDDRRVILWDAATGRERAVLAGHTDD